jgi:hypothetical protein
MNEEEFFVALDSQLRKNKIVLNVKGKMGLIEHNYTL